VNIDLHHTELAYLLKADNAGGAAYEPRGIGDRSALRVDDKAKLTVAATVGCIQASA
jgi:hypothetical protein